MNELKASLKLYFKSWKRSFDFFSEETKRELKNFIQITTLIGLILFISFISSYEEQIINQSTIKLYRGVALFWCYMAFAIFPFAGIVSRRLHTKNIDINKLTTFFNKNGILSILILYIMSGFYDLIYIKHGDILDIIATTMNGIMVPWLLVLFLPIYVAFIPLGMFCWNLSNINPKPEKKPINLHKLTKISLPIFMLLMFALNYSHSDIVFICTVVVGAILVFIAMYNQITYITNYLVFSSIAIFILSKLDILNTQRTFYYISLLLLPILYSFIKKKYSLNNKINFFIKLYAPLVLVIIILPLNIANPSLGSLGLSVNRNIQQDINIIGDKHINALSIPLLKTLSKEKKDKNILISVHNLYQGLGLLANGATDKTQEKLKQLLGSQSLDEINAKTKEIIENNSSAFKFKNTLTIANKNHLTTQFKDILKQYSDLKQKSNNQCEINYSSSLEFASSWKTKFGNNLTSHTFHTPTKDIKVQMMKDEREVYIAQGENFRVLALPYKSGDIFYIILPNKASPVPSSEIYDSFAEPDTDSKQNIINATLDEVIEKLTPTTFSNLNFEQHEIELMLPTFEFSENIDFKTTLNSLELGNLFIPMKSELNNILSPAANTADCSQHFIHIKSLNQTNKIKVDENGTIALSYQYITLDAMVGSIISSPFIVDRPFIFMINNGAFMGIINDPTQKGDSRK